MTELTTQKNNVRLCGTVETEPAYSHEVYGDRFYEFILKVPRLSGENDFIALTAPERLIDDAKCGRGDRVAVNGQFRSYRKMVGEKSKLMLSVLVRDFCSFSHENPNEVELSGCTCEPPIRRATKPEGEIYDLLIAVDRKYGKSDFIPCVARGEIAKLISGLKVRQKIAVQGKLQSREIAESEIRLINEVAIDTVNLKVR